MTTESNIQTGVAVAAAVSPLLPPNVQRAIAIASAALAALNTWQQGQGKSDISDAELQAVFDLFEVNRLDDLKAQADAVNLKHGG